MYVDAVVSTGMKKAINFICLSMSSMLFCVIIELFTIHKISARQWRAWDQHKKRWMINSLTALHFYRAIQIVLYSLLLTTEQHIALCITLQTALAIYTATSTP